MKKSERILEERKHLETLYGNVQGPFMSNTAHRNWTFTHQECGSEQTWRYGNVVKQLKLRPEKVPCTICGGKERMSKAMDAYVEKYGLTDEQLKQWNAYRQRVRWLTAKSYKEHRELINPFNLKRGVHDWHLDHRVPVIEGFLKNIPPEIIAAKENLQMLPAFENLSKGRSVL